MKAIVLLTLFCGFSFCSASPKKKLTAFEGELDQSFPVLIAQQELKTSKFALERTGANSGWKVFGNINTGYVQDIVDKGRTRDFTTLIGKLGIRHPLLGTAEKEQHLIIDANKDVVVKQLELDWIKKQLKIQLSQDYSAYWGAQQKERIGRGYSEISEMVLGILKHRETKGIVLKADRLESMTTFKRASYEILQSQHVMREVIDSMSAYLGREVLFFDAVKPFSDPVKQDIYIDIENHYEIKTLAALIETQQDIITHNKFRGIESNFNITHSVNLDDPVSDVGYGLIAGVNVQMPLSISNYRNADKEFNNTILRRLNTEYRVKQQQLTAKAETLILRHKRLSELISYQEQRLEAVSELLRERVLRMNKLDGDVIEKYLQALYEYYRVAIDLVDAQTEQWKTRHQLIEFIELDNHSDQVIDNNILIKPFKDAKQALNVKRPVQQSSTYFLKGLEHVSIYLWDSSGPLNNESKIFWQRMSEQKIKRILLSLNENQINLYQTQSAGLESFLKQAKYRSIKVDLLLGESSWILPENREKLIKIIRSLNYYDFNYLHLDLEINQLNTELGLQTIFTEWLETVRQVAIESRWALAISVHPRYLAKGYAGIDCFVCNLFDAGVSEIAVMIYVTNPVIVEKKMSALLIAYPMMKFRLAQSVEKVLEQANSYATFPPKKFQKNMFSLQRKLKRQHNFSGLAVQSWRDLEEYLYEN